MIKIPKTASPLLQNYEFDQYFRYPSTNRQAWISLLKKRIGLLLADKNTKIYSDTNNNFSFFFAVETSKWDEDHYGFKMGKIINPFLSGEITPPKIKEIISSIIHNAKNSKIRVLTARVNGDNLALIHAMEDLGFRYYETIIWPVVNLSSFIPRVNGVTYFDKKIGKVEELAYIAKNYQYQRGHYHCDCNFDKTAVNEMYAKWVTSAVSSNKKIAVIKEKKRIIGYFVCEIDDNLSKATGYKYGRLQSLAIDGSFQGRGHGKKLFEGTLALLQREGCQYVDSGYASKNHQSERLHVKCKFSGVYEEVTLHRWL